MIFPANEIFRIENNKSFCPIVNGEKLKVSKGFVINEDYKLLNEENQFIPHYFSQNNVDEEFDFLEGDEFFLDITIDNNGFAQEAIVKRVESSQKHLQEEQNGIKRIPLFKINGPNQIFIVQTRDVIWRNSNFDLKAFDVIKIKEKDEQGRTLYRCYGGFVQFSFPIQDSTIDIFYENDPIPKFEVPEGLNRKYIDTTDILLEEDYSIYLEIKPKFTGEFYEIIPYIAIPPPSEQEIPLGVFNGMSSVELRIVGAKNPKEKKSKVSADGSVEHGSYYIQIPEQELKGKIKISFSIERGGFEKNSFFWNERADSELWFQGNFPQDSAANFFFNETIQSIKQSNHQESRINISSAGEARRSVLHY